MAELCGRSAADVPVWTVPCLPDHTVCTLTNDILNLILVGDVEGDLPRPSLWRGLLGHGVGDARLDEQVNTGVPRREPHTQHETSRSFDENVINMESQLQVATSPASGPVDLSEQSRTRESRVGQLPVPILTNRRDDHEENTRERTFRWARD